MNQLPDNADIRTHLEDAYFADSFYTDIQYQGQSAMDVYMDLMKATPKWVSVLMALRNKVVGLFGLKNLGNLTDVDTTKLAADYQVGDKIGIFSLYSKSETEVIVEDRDNHLNVKLSFKIEPNGNTAKVHATSVVHVKNKLGRVYMFFVGPVHKIIVPSSLKQLPYAILS
ncbi:DUF2867 domain-containing protein [Vibrio sp. 99-70-13A1]|uniref:DUF2867 domain-containing protein n=1 Tax=Vibrio sp. 99-70-13A1 TaxID=2607601 RepID=UPI0014939906|nr:DUF2867 domain-containing protein [Vibrio sp. 99-70-13A1]NOH95987.1 DUF2867 domain-containing protein [Vibrio sp. 99-70-13A1]